MESLIHPIFIIQTISILSILMAIYIGYIRDKVEAFIIFISSCGSVLYGWFVFPDAIQNLYSNVTFVRLWIDYIAVEKPALVHSWEGISSWACVVFSALTAWVLLIAFIIMATDERIIRGTAIKAPNVMLKLLKKMGCPKYPIYIGQYFLPAKLETRSLALYGEPGTGKTQILMRMIGCFLKRGICFMCVDVGGEMYAKLGCKDDIILSVSHEEGIKWSPFAEINNGTDFVMVAFSLISVGSGETKTWNSYARGYLSVILKWCWKNNKTTNRDLLYFVTMAPRSELENLADGTPAQRLFDAGSEKMLSNIQSIVSQNLSSLELLDGSAGKTSFSIRKWVKENEHKGNLWIIYDDVSSVATSPLRTAWLEIMVKESLNLEPDKSRRLYFVLDELASNGKLEMLGQAVSRGRKYGVSLLLGIQNVAQLFSIYGRDEAVSILGSVGNNVVLRSPDPDTADYLSRAIGEKENERQQISVTHPSNNKTIQKVQVINRAVMASEISSLPDLRGYIKISGVGWAKIKIPLIKIKTKNELTEKQIDCFLNLQSEQVVHRVDKTFTLDEI